MHLNLEPQYYYCFETFEEAVIGIAAYRQRLAAIAINHASFEKTISDRDYPIDLIVLRPKQAKASPLVLIGGMGPLAGISGFEEACQLFQNEREIILIQACSIPDRTQVLSEIVQAGRKNSSVHQLILMLEKAVEVATSEISSKSTRIQMVFLCNTVHYFLPQLWRKLLINQPQLFTKLENISLIESVVQYLQNQGLRQPLLLCTSATRWGRVYANPLVNQNVELIEPNETLQLKLMDCIYRGVKAFNRDLACQIGEEFFMNLIQTQLLPDCIIAGCSEIPFLLTWLKADCTGLVQQFLFGLEIVDPVKIALKQADWNLRARL